MTKIIEVIAVARQKTVSSGFMATVFGIAAISVFGERALPILWLSIYFNAIVASYVINRILSKKNRGQFYSGFLTREFYWVFVAEAFNAWALCHGLDPVTGWGFIVGQIVLFNLARGVTKSIGVKTQMVFK